MIVTGIRYGGRSVRRVYLNDKVIWDTVILAGDTESSSYTKIVALTPMANLASGQYDASTYGAGVPKILEVVLANGKVEHYVDAKALIKILDVVMLHGLNEMTSSAAGVVKPIAPASMAVGADGRIKTYTDNITRLGNLVRAESNVEIDTYTNGVIAVNAHLPASAFTVSNSHANASVSCNWWVYVTANAEANTNGSAHAVIADLLKQAGTSNNNSYATAFGLLCDAVLCGGESASFSDYRATIGVLPKLDLSGYEESMSYDSSTIRLFFSNKVDGDNVVNFYVDGVGGSYDAILPNSNEKTESNVVASASVWYPPVGDGVPLVEADTDITKNGRILEMQQAYQINIDEENGILEVI